MQQPPPTASATSRPHNKKTKLRFDGPHKDVLNGLARDAKELGTEITRKYFASVSLEIDELCKLGSRGHFVAHLVCHASVATSRRIP